MGSRDSSDIDNLYLKSLEDRLKALKNPERVKNKPSQFISDLAQARDHHLFGLLTKGEDNRSDLEGKPVEKSWIQKKVAPASCEINTIEKKKLLKYDQFGFKIDFEAIGEVIHREVEAEKQDIDSEDLVDISKEERVKILDNNNDINPDFVAFSSEFEDNIEELTEEFRKELAELAEELKKDEESDQ